MKKLILVIIVFITVALNLSAKDLEFEGFKNGMTYKEVQKLLKTKKLKSEQFNDWNDIVYFNKFEEEIYNEITIKEVRFYYANKKNLSGFKIYINSDDAVDFYNEKILPTLTEYNFDWENNNKKTTSTMMYFVNVYNQDKVHLTFGLDLSGSKCWVLSITQD